MSRKKTAMGYAHHNMKWALWLVPIVGVGALAYWQYGAPDSTASTPPAKAAAVVEVAVATLETQTVQLHKDLPSRAIAYKIADIRPQVSGIVTKRLFEEGRVVTQGQPLYQIDPAPYKAVYDSAYADLNRTKTNVKLVQAKVNRYTKLRKSNAVSQQAYEDVIAAFEQATADVAVAEAAVASAQVNLNYTKVSAPISGRIGKSSVTPGALVTANQTGTLATVTQLDPIYVDLIMPSRDLIRLRPQFEDGQKLRVSLYDDIAQSTYAHEGELQFSEVTVDQSTGTVLLRALFPNPDRLLLPGMFLRAQLHLRPQEALLVPQSAAIRDAEGKLSVWVVGADNTVQPTPIEAHQAAGNRWVVESGIDSGVTIVTKGFQRIAPGATVKAAPEDPAPDDPASTPQPDKAE